MLTLVFYLYGFQTIWMNRHNLCSYCISHNLEKTALQAIYKGNEANWKMKHFSGLWQTVLSGEPYEDVTHKVNTQFKLVEIYTWLIGHWIILLYQ